VFAKNNLSKEESVKQALKERSNRNGESVIRAAVNYNIERTVLLRKVIIVIN
jgi:regulatory protein YycH of two-component signal transduction system YycFG